MSKPTVLVIGGTGAQGGAVVRVLASSGAYNVKILTRNTESAAAKEYAALPDVSLIAGDASNEHDILRAFQGVNATFVNTNGFAIGEKAEIYWGIRTFELALVAGVKHFVWGGLEYGYKLGHYDPKFRVGHLDGKGKVAGEDHAIERLPNLRLT
jgi:NAD(P)-dependent dehydrogenase (short-subunit alcohol dehydrogenase family)